MFRLVFNRWFIPLFSYLNVNTFYESIETMAWRTNSKPAPGLKELLVETVVQRSTDKFLYSSSQQ